jgi:hypothetical protein
VIKTPSELTHMSKAQNINIGKKRRQGNMPLQKANNNIIEDFV